MPKTANYRANSVIYFEGDRDERVYILKSGKVVLSAADIETNEVIRNTVELGEFFGVKAALGHYPREEDAMVLVDSVVVVLTVPEFEQLALNNSQIVTKMLKVFSNQLRRLHTKVQSMLNENRTTIDAEAGLFQCAEYYMSNQSYESATHALTRYLQYYPNNTHTQISRQYLQEAQAALGWYNTGTEHEAPPTAAVAPPTAAVAPPPPPMPAAPVIPSPEPAVEVTFNTAKRHFDNGNFPAAIEQFRVLVEKTNNPLEKQSYTTYIGRCQLDNAQYSEAIRTFSQMLQESSDIKDIDLILYYMGHAYHHMNNQPKAEAFLKRALMITKRGDSFKELIQNDLAQ